MGSASLCRTMQIEKKTYMHQKAPPGIGSINDSKIAIHVQHSQTGQFWTDESQDDGGERREFI